MVLYIDNTKLVYKNKQLLLHYVCVDVHYGYIYAWDHVVYVDLC